MLDPTALALASFALAAGVLTITPGVDTAMVLRSTAAGGVRGGARAALGISAGLLVWGAGAAIGLNALLLASELAYTALKWAGAAYLLYLGVKLVAAPRRAFDAAVAAPDAGRALRNGLVTNLLNPKVGVFYASFLPQFAPEGAPVAPFTMMLACIHVALGLIWFAGLIAMTTRLTRVLARPGVVTALDRLTGGVFIAFGVNLALTQRA